MQRAPYLLGERADSIRKGVIDPYGSHTYTFWRVHGWRMSLYSLARALRTHGRHYMFTRRSSSVDPDACLAAKESINATVAAVICTDPGQHFCLALPAFCAFLLLVSRHARLERLARRGYPVR